MLYICPHDRHAHVESLPCDEHSCGISLCCRRLPPSWCSLREDLLTRPIYKDWVDWRWPYLANHIPQHRNVMRIFRSLLCSILLCLTLVRASLVDDIINAIKNGVTCGGCHSLLAPLKVLALLGDGPFVGTFTAVCKGLTSFDDDVCEGAVRTQAPIIAHDLRSINPFGQTARKLCDGLLGLCQPPAVNQYQVPFPKPPPATPKTFVSTGKTPFKVVHFSDIHIDRNYTVGADTTCTKPICCRHWNGEPGPVANPAGPMGSRNCDTPPALAQHFLNTISSDNKFSIFTGDVIEATVWLAEQGFINHEIQLFNNEIATLPDVPVYAAVGNHEGAPTNAFPRNTTSKANNQWLFDTLISINTVYWYKHNYWLYDSDTVQPDPNGVLSFVVSQLQAAEDAGQRAWLVGHIPPGGRTDVMSDQIVQRYRHVIAGQFYGHSHQDEFMVGYSDNNRRSADTAITAALIAPAFTPRSSNPGFKVYDIDPDTYEVMDYKVYRTDTTSPDFHIEPKWELSYSARETYSRYVPDLQPQDSLSPAFWHRLTEAFENDDSAFETYLGFKRGPGVETASCDAQCRRNTICDIRALKVEHLCTPSSPGLNFRRSLEGHATHDHGHHDECEGPGINAIFQAATTATDVDWDALRKELEAIIPASA
ncbi:sphingomyelin phosphodiesterase [Coprinopsis cinerea okayama7|uniref:Sphingomyelin phosphodiesterase n=1 Tax=Coprinopsis cinerea (strain Okayama-7 / 130 / ATCC MYA-4618 / FGSC 9003) TaxID=240176 RepID=A8N066_COPC7|nr:sphingomyelin phosphodiesterase [Coprinopsis cinerea okayama7\|eukprot:XP_001828254.2 sphingomyelin phosphodiesterase [Coprinopsis cinerea okayama7\